MSDRAAELRRALVRNLDEVKLERQQREPLYDTQCASLSAGTAASKLGAGYDVLAPGKRSCPYHLHHAQEEMFVILEGHGTLRVAGEMVPVRAGDVVFIPPGPEYPHQFINTSDAPMRYLSISTQERPELCEYPDSGKVAGYGRGLRIIQRPGEALDYWDGEP
ncbi:cupin domain-containing protein [Piscinibacter aquaticus]|uniref:Cupin domain-containing protein n=1 Tax=Piscinibacter aquaticus TaxID=392597 RepID=A0A5C6TY37_9BURK|nr:cupin domain-containing protein [Piscinibacter aquaticus]